MLKIFHTADVHLDAPFSLSDPLEAEKRRTGLRSTFCSMIDAARRMEADVFLIAGDLFEDGFVTKDTVSSVLRQMESFSACTFFIVPGNHDPYNDRSPYALLKWPENVRIFTDERPAYFDLPEKNARIYGHAYTSKTIPDDLFSGFRAEDPEKINVLVAHGFVDRPHDGCNVLMRADLEKSGFDYVALGHIHSHSGFEKAGNTVYAYSGCAVGRSFDECGRKYALIVGIEKENGVSEVKTALYPCTERRFECRKVDLSGTLDNDEALEKIRSAAADYGEEVSLRLILDGAVSPDVSIRLSDVRSCLKRPEYLELRDETIPLFDVERLKKDPTIAGAFYRRLEKNLLSDDPAVRRRASFALRFGLSALCGRDIEG